MMGKRDRSTTEVTEPQLPPEAATAPPVPEAPIRFGGNRTEPSPGGVRGRGVTPSRREPGRLPPPLSWRPAPPRSWRRSPDEAPPPVEAPQPAVATAAARSGRHRRTDGPPSIRDVVAELAPPAVAAAVRPAARPSVARRHRLDATRLPH